MIKSAWGEVVAWCLPVTGSNPADTTEVHWAWSAWAANCPLRWWVKGKGHILLCALVCCVTMTTSLLSLHFTSLDLNLGVTLIGNQEALKWGFQNVRMVETNTYINSPLYPNMLHFLCVCTTFKFKCIFVCYPTSHVLIVKTHTEVGSEARTCSAPGAKEKGELVWCKL